MSNPLTTLTSIVKLLDERKIILDYMLFFDGKVSINCKIEGDRISRTHKFLEEIHGVTSVELLLRKHIK